MQAVDIINNSAVFLQWRPLSWLGVLIVSVAVRDWKTDNTAPNTGMAKCGNLNNYPAIHHCVHARCLINFRVTVTKIFRVNLQ